MSLHDPKLLVKSLLQDLKDTYSQVQSQAGTLTLSQSQALEKWLDLLRESPERLNERQQCKDKKQTAQKVAHTIYSTIGREAFVLFACTTPITAIHEANLMIQFMPGFRGWWQRQTPPPSLQSITAQKQKEHHIDELVSSCNDNSSQHGKREKKRTRGIYIQSLMLYSNANQDRWFSVTLQLSLRGGS